MPSPTEAQKAKIEQTAQSILDARALYSDSSLADLYDEVKHGTEHGVIVQELSLAFDKVAVRDYVGALVAFDRRNFLAAANKIVERELGARDLCKSFAPFLRFPVKWRKLDDVFAPLLAA